MNFVFRYARQPRGYYTTAGSNQHDAESVHLNNIRKVSFKTVVLLF